MMPENLQMPNTPEEDAPLRILVSPYPDWSGGPHINVCRVIEKLQPRGCRFTGKCFHRTGFHPGRADLVWMVNNPRWMKRILAGRRPVVSRMGQFTYRECSEKLGFEYTSEHERQRDEMVRIVQEADRVVFISNWVMENFKREFEERDLEMDVSRCDVIRNGVDLQLFRPPEHPQGSPFVLGLSGKLRNRFRFDTLFKVSRALPFEHKILVVGALKDDGKQALEEYMQDSTLRERTEYLGRLEPDALPPAYRRMSCLLHPVAGESCSTVIPEALACGVPVVVPEYGAPSEYIGEGGVAVPGEPWDYNHRDFIPRMAEAVERIYRDHEKYSIEARRSAESRLDLDQAADRWLGHFQSVLVR